MVSFSCEVCNDTIIKKKLNQHKSQCHQAYFTCIDCNKTFYDDYDKHTSCITEAEKYEKALYKPKKQAQKPVQKPKVEESKVEEVKVEKKEKKEKKSKDKKVKEDKKEGKKESKKEDKKEKELNKLKISKPLKFKKFLKSLDKSQAKALENLKITKTDDSFILHF